jgi:hypothetical protein
MMLVMTLTITGHECERGQWKATNGRKWGKGKEKILRGEEDQGVLHTHSQMLMYTYMHAHTCTCIHTHTQACVYI